MAEHTQNMSLNGQGLQEQAGGLVEKIKSWWNSLGIMDQIKASKYTLLEIGAYALVGFIIGLLVKRYLKYILLLVLFVVTLIIMQQFDLLHIDLNWPKLQELFNLRGALPSEDAQLAHAYWQWTKANAGLVAGASVGFLIGLNVG